jgi:hypothetical protein
MTRRELLTSMLLFAGSHAARADPQLEISATHLRRQIEEFSPESSYAWYAGI